MRVDLTREQALAALSQSNAARSPTPELRSANVPHAGPQQAQASARLMGDSSQRAASAMSLLPQRTRPAGAIVRIDEATSRWVAQLVDENNEVIRQIPPEELLEIAAKFRRLQGLLFDERA